MKRLISFLIWVSILSAVAGQPSSHYKLIYTQESPKRTLIIQYYKDMSNGTAQVWTAKTDNPTNKALLFEYGDPASVTTLVSADDKWLVINDREGSDDAGPILFERIRGGHFRRAKDADLDQIVWNAAAKNRGFTKNAVFDHRYSEVLCWLGESHCLVLRAWGYYSGEYSLGGDWFCIYNVDTRSVFLDLNVLNGKANRVPVTD